MEPRLDLGTLAAFATAFAVHAAHAKPIVVDNYGTRVTLDKAPEGMVVHDINMSEMACALGLQDKMVGVTSVTGWYKTTPGFDAARWDIPELAPKYSTLENLVAASPDIFFAGWYYGMKPGGDVTPETLAPLGINTLILSESCIHLTKDRLAAMLDLLYGEITRLGAIFRKEAEAAALISGWKDWVAEIKAGVIQFNGKRVFLNDSGDDKPFAAGKEQSARGHGNTVFIGKEQTHGKSVGRG